MINEVKTANLIYYFFVAEIRQREKVEHVDTKKKCLWFDDKIECLISMLTIDAVSDVKQLLPLDLANTAIYSLLFHRTTYYTL